MDLLFKNITAFILNAVWTIHLFFGKIPALERNEEGNETVQKKSKPVIDHKKQKVSKSSSNLLLNPNDKSILNLSDLITPVEEEMLRCLCAKGYTRSTKTKQFDTVTDVCIPRDTFTNIWIDSCSNV